MSKTKKKTKKHSKKEIKITTSHFNVDDRRTTLFFINDELFSFSTFYGEG